MSKRIQTSRKSIEIRLICLISPIHRDMKAVPSRILLAMILTMIVTAGVSTFPVRAVGEYKLVQIDPSNHVPDYYGVEIPWFQQENSISCGPACIKMVFAKHDWTITEEEIQQAANMKPSHGGTLTTDMVRAAHFSNRSTALDNASLRGYTSKPCGSDSVGSQPTDENKVDMLKRFLLQEQSPILLMWYTVAHNYGHYRVLRAYDDRSDALYFADPMGYNATLGVNWTLPYDEFINDWWSYSGYWLQVISDWNIEISINESVSEPSSYAVNATISTGIEQKLRDPQSILRACSARINLPDGWELNSGTSEIPIEFNQQGVTSVRWEITQQDGSEQGNITVTARGRIGGQTASYDSYEDRICASESVDVFALQKPSLVKINIGHTDEGLEVLASIRNSNLVRSCKLLWRNNPSNWETVPMEAVDSESYSASMTIPEPRMEKNESLQIRFVLTDENSELIQTAAYEYRFYESPVTVVPMIIGGVVIVTVVAVIVLLHQIGLLRLNAQE